MAKVVLFEFTGTDFHGDVDAQLVGGDAAAPPTVMGVGRSALVLDDTIEAAFLTGTYFMSELYTGLGTLKATVGFSMASDATNTVVNDVFVEAVTPDDDTHDMTTANWDSANVGIKELAGSTALDPLTVTIDLTNKQGVVKGDQVRFGFRRDTDHGDHDASGNQYVISVEIWEDQ